MIDKFVVMVGKLATRDSRRNRLFKPQSIKVEVEVKQKLLAEELLEQIEFK